MNLPWMTWRRMQALADHHYANGRHDAAEALYSAIQRDARAVELANDRERHRADNAASVWGEGFTVKGDGQ